MNKSRRNNRTRSNRKNNNSGRRFAAAGSRSSTATNTRVSPDELDVKLMFRDFRTFTNALSPLGAKAYHSNAAYDVDPSLGSTETYGFDEYAALYSYYRVIGYSYEVTIMNPMDYNLMAYVLNTNVDPVAIGTRFDLYSTNPHCQSKLITFKAPNTVTFKGSHRISQIAGTPSVETSDSFRALTTGLPSDLTWITIGAEALAPATDVTFSYDLKLIMHVRFYAREVDLTLGAFAVRVEKHLAARVARNAAKQRLLGGPKHLRVDKPESTDDDVTFEKAVAAEVAHQLGAAIKQALSAT